MTKLFRATALASVLATTALFAQAAAFTAGDVAVYRVGTGSSSLTNASTAVFIDEYTPTGTFVQSIAMPTLAATALTASGTATSEGLLTLSADGQYLMLTGYGATTGTSGIASTASAAVNRVIGRVDMNGNVDTSTRLTDAADGNNIRGVASTDGSSLWLTGGAGGVRYTTLGASTSTQLSTTVTNLRSVEIVDNQLYTSTGSGSTIRVGTVGTGLPSTSGQTISNLPGFATSGSPYAFYLADLSAAVSGLDTLYVADDAAGLQKYSLVGGSWILNATLGTNADDYRGLTATVSGGSVSLFATRKGGSGTAGGGELVLVTDSSGYNSAFSSSSATVLATASANTAFRGVALAPVPEPAGMALVATGLLALTLGGKRRR